MIILTNPSNFRECIIMSILSERPICIKDIGSNKHEQGIQDYEVRFIKLIQKVTNGTKVVIDKQGNEVKFYPGILTNNQGSLVDFNCGNQRAIGYYLYYLLIILVFGKTDAHIKLSGITNDHLDLSVDSILQICPHILKLFNEDIQVSHEMQARQFRPIKTNEQPNKQQGSVTINVSIVKYIKCIDLTSLDLFYKIRGISYSGNVNSQFVNRMVSSVRGVLNQFTNDIWIKTDQQKQPFCNQGYGVSLHCISKNNLMVSAEQFMKTFDESRDLEPEQVGQLAAQRLIDEIVHSGIVDTNFLSFLFILMSISEKRISKAKVGRLNGYSICTLKIIQQFLGVKFHIENVGGKQIKDEQEEEDDSEQMKQQTNNLIMSCLGVGINNLSRIVK